MKSKHFFTQFKEEIDEEHKKFKTHQETVDIPINRCDHKGKVKIIDGELRCSCGCGWSGSQINFLFDIFNK